MQCTVHQKLIFPGIILGMAVLLLTGYSWAADRGDQGLSPANASAATTETAEPTGVDIFDAIDQGVVDVKFVARNARQGRLVFTNNTSESVQILVPEAFAAVPVALQVGGIGGGGGGVAVGGGGQSVGGGRGGGGAFNVAPEKVGRLDVPLVCLDHGLRDPSSSKPYEIRPIEDIATSPALIEIIKAYAQGQLAHGISQAAVWHIHSEVSWPDLATKLTGTVRSMVREPYFSGEEIQAAMAVVQQAHARTAGQTIQRRNWKPADRSQPTEVAESYTPSADKEIDTAAELALEAEQAD